VKAQTDTERKKPSERESTKIFEHDNIDGCVFVGSILTCLLLDLRTLFDLWLPGAFVHELSSWAAFALRCCFSFIRTISVQVPPHFLLLCGRHPCLVFSSSSRPSSLLPSSCLSSRLSACSRLLAQSPPFETLLRCLCLSLFLVVSFSRNINRLVQSIESLTTRRQSASGQTRLDSTRLDSTSPLICQTSFRRSLSCRTVLVSFTTQTFAKFSLSFCYFQVLVGPSSFDLCSTYFLTFSDPSASLRRSSVSFPLYFLSYTYRLSLSLSLSLSQHLLCNLVVIQSIWSCLNSRHLFAVARQLLNVGSSLPVRWVHCVRLVRTNVQVRLHLTRAVRARARHDRPIEYLPSLSHSFHPLC
jgi:hypothetical protein